MKARPKAGLLGTSLACLLIVACGKQEPAAVAVVAAPAPAPAAAAPAPVPGAEPALSPEHEVLLAAAKASSKCSLAFFQTTGFRPSVKNVVVERGLIGQLAADAQATAADEVAWWFSRFPPTNDVEQAERYLNALGEHAFVLIHPPEERMRAELFLAYYTSIATAPRCPLDAESLAFIGKTP